eukprot:SAG25_NODE_1294_length_3369_cov_6.537486_4_plen_105_part_00
MTPQDHVLGALANQRAEDAAKKSLQKPDLRDEAAEMKALEEGKAGLRAAVEAREGGRLDEALKLLGEALAIPQVSANQLLHEKLKHELRSTEMQVQKAAAEESD